TAPAPTPTYTLALHDALPISHPFFESHWARYYRAIRNANVILDNLANVSLPEDQSQLFAAEARFVRAKAYLELYNLFGPVPLLRSEEHTSELQSRENLVCRLL